jgi:hypothetical protein
VTLDQVQAFLTVYRDAFNRLDGDAVADLWHAPCGITQGDGITWWAEDAPKRANHRALCEVYRKADYGRADFTILHHEPLGPQHDFVNVRWVLVRTNRTPLQTFATAYQLLRTPAGPRVFMCTAYEEELEEMKRHATV